MQNPFSGSGKADIVRRLPDVASETIDDYIADAWPKALAVAPCIGQDTFDEDEKGGEVKAILRGIILRWHDLQSGVKVQQAAGPYQQTIDPGPVRGWHLWPREIVELQRLCERQGRPFSVDTVPEDYDDGPAETFLNGPHNRGVLPPGPMEGVPQILLNGAQATN